jgi:hypothetical protein
MALPSQETLKSDVDPVVKRKAAVARLARWKLITSVVKLQQVPATQPHRRTPIPAESVRLTRTSFVGGGLRWRMTTSSPWRR